MSLLKLFCAVDDFRKVAGPCLGRFPTALASSHTAGAERVGGKFERPSYPPVKS